LIVKVLLVFQEELQLALFKTPFGKNIFLDRVSAKACSPGCQTEMEKIKKKEMTKMKMSAHSSWLKNSLTFLAAQVSHDLFFFWIYLKCCTIESSKGAGILLLDKMPFMTYFPVSSFSLRKIKLHAVWVEPHCITCEVILMLRHHN